MGCGTQTESGSSKLAAVKMIGVQDAKLLGLDVPLTETKQEQRELSLYTVPLPDISGFLSHACEG